MGRIHLDKSLYYYGVTLISLCLLKIKEQQDLIWLFRMKHYLNFFLTGVFVMPLFGPTPGLGKPAPEFSLPDQDGTMHSLQDYRGQRLVVYFFPKADTPGWIKQACGFRDESETFEKYNIAILGVSYDSPGALRAFKSKYNIPFHFLSDTKKETGMKYGVNRILFPARKTFLIDENGILIHIIDNVNLHTHPRDVLSIFEAEKLSDQSNYIKE